MRRHRAASLLAFCGLLCGCSDGDLPPSPATFDAAAADGGLRFDKDGVIVGADASPPKVDSGSVPDSGPGPTDGGQADAGLDAGPPPEDAGPTDGGPPDAGPVDAGPVDAGCPDCCTLGVCCDDSTGKAKVAGAACGQEPAKVAYKCAGSTVERREGFAGCDGVHVVLCSADPAHMSWSGWKVIETCAGGKACLPAVGEAKPSCPEVPVECKTHGDCADTKGCTQDLCDAGKCLHLPASAGTPCGDKVLATEYKCSSAAKGGTIQMHEAVAGCDGKAETCPVDGSGKAWKPWTSLKTCPWDQVCMIQSPDQPGTCAATPKCTPGTTCCADDGFYAAKGIKCGDYAYKTEAKCLSEAKGGKIAERKAFGGCTGASTWCSSTSESLVWGEWAETKACKANEVCSKGWSAGTVQCKDAGVCSPSNSCCTEAGEYAAKATKCSDYAYGTEKKCESENKGGKILQRKGYGGCDGKSSWCSSSKDNLVWGEWQPIQTCAADQVCVSTQWSTYCQ